MEQRLKGTKKNKQQMMPLARAMQNLAIGSNTLFFVVFETIRQKNWVLHHYFDIGPFTSDSNIYSYLFFFNDSELAQNKCYNLGCYSQNRANSNHHFIDSNNPTLYKADWKYKCYLTFFFNSYNGEGRFEPWMSWTH